LTPQAQYPYPLPLRNPMWSNQGTGSNADGSAQVNLGGMTLAWMGVFQDIVALCRVTLIVETLTQDYDVAPPTAPANGQLLAVILTQDSIGGHTVTWDSMNQTMLYAPTANSAFHRLRRCQRLRRRSKRSRTEMRLNSRFLGL